MSKQRTGCFSWMIRVGGLSFIAVIVLAMVNRRDPADLQSPTPKAEDTANLSDSDFGATENAKRPIIPGLLAADVHLNLTNRGFRLESDMGKTQCEWRCSKELPWGRMHGDCFGPTPNALWSVQAIVAAPEAWEAEELKAAKEFLPFMATLPFEGATPEAASKWVSEHIGENVTKKFGPCQMQLMRGTGYALEISAIRDTP